MVGKAMTSETLRELVEGALEGEDIVSLVRLVFDTHPSDSLPLPLPVDSESGTTTLDEAGALLRENPLEAVLEVLQEVAEDKEAEIAQICRANALEIAAALHDLAAMQRQVAALRQRLGANNAALQGAGGAFLAQLEGMAGMVRVQQGVADTRKAVGTAVQALSFCRLAGRHIESRQLYKAFRVLEAIQREYGSVLRGAADGRGLLLDMKDGASPSKLPLPQPAPAVAAAAAAVAPPAHLGPLVPFLRDRVNELTLAVEQRAMADFNDWLVTVRTQARTIGLRAIRWAAAERQHEEALARQRKEVLARLQRGGGRGPAAAAAAAGPEAAAGAHVGRIASLAEVGREIAAALREPEVKAALAATPMPLPRGRSPAAGQAPGTPTSSGSSPRRAAASDQGSPGRAPSPGKSPLGTASSSYRALRQQASALRTPPAPAAAAPAVAASSSKQGGPATPTQRSAYHQQQHLAEGEGEGEGGAGEATGDLLEGVDMAPLHRCVHIHACLRRLPALRDYYVDNRRRQLDADLALGGPFLEAYQAYLTQIVGYFLVEERVQRSTAGVAGTEGLDISAQVGAAWERAVGTLKGVLDAAFQGATAAPAMLTVKDFMLLVCLALEQCGYHAVAVREILMNGRAKYYKLLGAATAEAVQAAVAKDPGLEAVEVRSEGRAEELFRLLALPSTFHSEDAPNKRPPFKAPFTPMVPDLVRIIRGYIMDSVAYLKGLVSAGEVVPAAKQYRDRMLARVVVDTLQRRVDACAGEKGLPLARGLQLVANVAALMQALQPLDDFAVMQARGEPADAVPPSRSPSPPARGSPGGSPRPAASGASGAEGRGSSFSPDRLRRRSLEAIGAPQRPASPTAAPGGTGGGSCDASPGAASSRGSAPSPSAPQGPAHPRLATVRQQGGAAEHMTLSFTTAGQQVAGGGPAAAGGGSVAAAAFQTLLESAEALVVQAVAQRVAALLAGGEGLDWVPDQPQRSLQGGCTAYVEETILYVKECGSVMARAAPDASVSRMLTAVFRYLADAVMLQLMSDAIPAYNIFGLQRLMSDLGGLSRCAGSMGVPGLADALQEPLLFCELMVFGSLEELLRPELREGKYAALNLRRVGLILDKYRELDRHSSYSAMHRSKQAERFISRKTVESVARQLRETGRAASSGRASWNSDRSG